MFSVRYFRLGICSHLNFGCSVITKFRKPSSATILKVQMLEAREISISRLEKKLQQSRDEFAAEQKFRSLEEQYQKEIAELKVQNQKLMEENKAFEEKFEEMIQINQKKMGETHSEIISLNTEMKVQLPLENWHDLLASVPRPQLGNVASDVGDRQFAQIPQSFLHDEVREITLGKMSIIAPRPDVPSDQPMVKVWPNKATNMPDWPMPGNIKDFKEIAFNYMDTPVLHFLEKFQENFLLENVNMNVAYVGCDDHYYGTKLNEHILRRVLVHILPLISSINSIQIDDRVLDYSDIDLFNIVYNNNNNNTDNNDHDVCSRESQLLLLKEMMAKTRILSIGCLHDWNPYRIKCSWEDKMDWCCSWLYTPREDGNPRMLKASCNCNDVNDEPTDCASFIERIKEDFKSANNPASFFIHICIHRDNNVEDISVENVKTNEKLVLKKVYGGEMLLIARYPLNAAKSWIEENENEISWFDNEKLDRKITMDNELTTEI